VAVSRPLSGSRLAAVRRGIAWHNASPGKELAKLNEELSSAELELEGKQKLKKATVEEKEASEAYLAKIKRGCDWIDANIENRQQARSDETRALLNAKQIIKSTPAYTNAVEAQRQEDLGDCKDRQKYTK